MNGYILNLNGEKHPGKRRKCWQPAFPPFPTMFSKAVLLVVLTPYHTIPTFNNPEKESYKNIAGMGVNAGYQHFLLFPQCSLLFRKQNLIFWSHLFCRLQVFHF